MGCGLAGLEYVFHGLLSEFLRVFGIVAWHRIISLHPMHMVMRHENLDNKNARQAPLPVGHFKWRVLYNYKDVC